MIPPRGGAANRMVANTLLVRSLLAHKLDSLPGKSGFTDKLELRVPPQLNSLERLVMRYQLHGVAASIARAGSPRRRKIVLAIVLFWQVCVIWTLWTRLGWG